MVASQFSDLRLPSARQGRVTRARSAMRRSSADVLLPRATRTIDQQLAAIRAAAFGLTEKQARETPRRSALCDFFQPYHPASGTLLA
jgi:hypothetical protein